MNNNKVYANKIDKNIDNNAKVYYSNNQSEDRGNLIKKLPEMKNNSKNISQKINDIFNSKSYIYKADVIIKTKNGEIKKRLVGKNSRYLITSSNELIPIIDVIDIKYQ